MQAQLDAQAAGGEGGGLQLDPEQLAECRQLKEKADVKTGKLLQDKAAVEAQLKVCLLGQHLTPDVNVALASCTCS